MLGYIPLKQSYFSGVMSSKLIFQWQEVRDEYLGPKFCSILLQCDSKFWIKNNKSTVRSASLRKRSANDAGLYDWNHDKDNKL